jgi:hypothetical protein
MDKIMCNNNLNSTQNKVLHVFLTEKALYTEGGANNSNRVLKPYPATVAKTATQK